MNIVYGMQNRVVLMFIDVTEQRVASIFRPDLGSMFLRNVSEHLEGYIASDLIGQ
jgi:hypothetical protein